MRKYLLFISIILTSLTSYSQNSNKLDIFSLEKREKIFNEKMKKIGLSQREIDSLKNIMEETLPLLVSNSHQTDSIFRKVELKKIIKNRNLRIKNAVSSNSFKLIQDSILSDRKSSHK